MLETTISIDAGKGSQVVVAIYLFVASLDISGFSIADPQLHLAVLRSCVLQVHERVFRSLTHVTLLPLGCAYVESMNGLSNADPLPHLVVIK